MTVLLAATGRGAVRAHRSGGSWATLRALEDADVRCLATGGAGAIYAGTHAGAVYRSDSGESWQETGVFSAPVTSLAVVGDTVYAGTKEPRVHVSADRGASWRPLARFPRLRSWWWAQPAQRPFRPSYVSALLLAPGAIVAGIEACGVFRSTDGGEGWSGHRRRALRDCHDLTAAGEWLYEAGAGGLAASSDGGRRWHRRREGLDRRYGWSVAVDGETVYLAAAPYRSAHTRNSRACIFRSTRGAAWERCAGELSSLPRLAACGPGELFAALADGSLLYTGDRGETWTPLPVDFQAPSRALLAIPD